MSEHCNGFEITVENVTDEMIKNVEEIVKELEDLRRKIKKKKLYKKYREKNKDKLSYKNNRQRFRENYKRWRLNNLDKARQNFRDWAKDNPEKAKANCLRMRRSLNGVAGQIWNSARIRANKCKLKFSITKEWILEKLKHGLCEVTKKEFILEAHNPWRPSLDQIIPGEGYTIENCQVVACIYNFAKHKYSHQDVIELAKALLLKE